MKDWYGQGDYPLHVTSATAVWYKTGMPAVPIRWVLIKDPKGSLKALLCTDLTATPVQILQWFRSRWQVEVTFEARAHLGLNLSVNGHRRRSCVPALLRCSQS